MTKIQETGDKVLANVERVIVGKHHEVRLALVALLCRGHLLIEDVPGTGKTVLAKAIAKSLGLDRNTVAKYVGPAREAGFGPGTGPPPEGWAAFVARVCPQLGKATFV